MNKVKKNNYHLQLNQHHHKILPILLFSGIDDKGLYGRVER